MLNKNGLLALAEEVAGSQNVVASQGGAVDYGDKITLRVDGAVQVGVNGSEILGHTFGDMPGNLATVNLDDAEL